MRTIGEYRVTMMTRVDIRMFSLRSVAHLAGPAEGANDRKLIGDRLRNAYRAIVAFDFADIKIFAPSYFKTAMMPIWLDPGAGREFFPIVTNVNGDIEDDLMVSMECCNISIWEETSAARGEREYAPFAKLEGALFDTLSIVNELDQVTAGSLADKYRNVGSTAWSNRLAALYDRKMLARYKHGRQLVYMPPWMFNTVRSDLQAGVP